MKRFPLLAALLFCAVAASADQFDDFNARVRADLVKPFALDLGGILGGATGPNAKPLGFPGFSVGVNAATQFRPDKNNQVLRQTNVKAFGLPFVEVGVGLPLGVDLLAHGTKVGDFQVLGGGVRYSIFKSGLVTMAIPSLTLSGFYDAVDHDFFTASHYAANASAMWNKLPVIHPFITAGMDSTKVTVGTMATSAAARGVSATATGSRVAAGVDITPFPLFHLHAAYALRHGIPGADFGLSVSF